MPDIRLSESKDVYTYAAKLPWVNIFGLGGDDQISFYGNACVIGGPGDDVITNLATEPWALGQVAYWDSPAAITVDLQAGYALDGWGSRDTLINIRDIWTGGRDGDKVYGTSTSDSVGINGFFRGRNSFGSALIDFRDGVDTANFYDVPREGLNIVVSADGSTVNVSGFHYSATLLNVEVLNFIDPAPNGGPNKNTAIQVADLIDFSQVGAATLLAFTQKPLASGSVNFSFMRSAPSYGGTTGGAAFVAPNADYQGAVRTILFKLSTMIGLNFVEVPDTTTGYGLLRFGANEQTATKGYSFMPGSTGDHRDGDVWLDVDTLSVLQEGQEGWQVLLHEIGHALGLTEPTSDGTTQAASLLSRWNDNRYTVMSPNQAKNGLWQSWYGPLDLQALGKLYGSRTASSNAADDTYRFKDSQGGALATLVDTGGYDTLDTSSLSVGTYINLTPGTFSSVGYTAAGKSSIDNLYIDPNSNIERVVGTPFDDVIIGNSADNIMWPGKGNDWIDGKGGFNTAIYDDAKAADYRTYKLQDGTGAWVVEDAVGSGGSDTLFNIQRVYFSDKNLALDIVGKAGDAARVVSTVYGLPALKDVVLVGGVLKSLDSGASVSQVYVAALSSKDFARLAGGNDDMSFMKQMFRNLLDMEVSSATAQPFVDQFLGSGAYTQATFADAASVLIQPQLVGIAITGLAYS